MGAEARLHLEVDPRREAISGSTAWVALEAAREIRPESWASAKAREQVTVVAVEHVERVLVPVELGFGRRPVLGRRPVRCRWLGRPDPVVDQELAQPLGHAGRLQLVGEDRGHRDGHVTGRSRGSADSERITASNSHSSPNG